MARSNSSLQILEQIQDERLGGHVEGGGGLVQDEKVGMGQQRHGDGAALQHAAGQLMGVALDHGAGVGHVDPVEHGQ